MTEIGFGTPLVGPHILSRTEVWRDGETVSIEANDCHLLLVLQPGGPHGLAVDRHGREVVRRALHNSITFLPEGHAVRLRPIGGPASILALAIQKGWIEDNSGVREPAFRTALIEPAPRIVDAVRWIQGSSCDLAPPPDNLVHRLLARLLATAFGELARRPDDSWLPAAALGRISRLMNGAQLGQLTIASLAANAGLGVSAFSRAFRGSTGWTPGNHLIAARLDRVTSMLDSTDLPLAEITRRVGLSSVAHVSQQFCSRHGMSARRYRESRAGRTLEPNHEGSERLTPQLPR